ncbi:unnamed protein product [Adineta steineri]|uniref:Uncharacterized protein n=1 Tax=Adineta steineri TaxID=433720 RepID=A0A815NJ35_9BILA|nr:unnamed protein product [Adineta steineri]
MFTSINNRTVFDIPLTWNRTRFEASRLKCRQARKIVETSINAQFNKQLKDVFFQKLDIEKNTTDSQERIVYQEKKVRALDNLTDVAAQSLNDYFDKRMENVRTAIQEHCNAIQQILREENDHWQEIHTAIDQNMITSNDIHPPNKIDEEIPLTNIHTIDEADEDEHTSRLLNNKTVTPLLTEMIRKSRLHSNRSSLIQYSIPISTENLIQTKQEQFSIIQPLNSARRTLHVIDTTFVVKLEESKSIEPDQLEIPPIASSSPSIVTNPIQLVPTTTSIPNEPLSVTTVTPNETLPTPEVDTTPSYSQPKPPARLYFSPTLLLDDVESEPIQPVLSTIDQNQTRNEKPKLTSRRFGQTFLLDNIKSEKIDESQDTENLRPKVSDDIPLITHSDPTLLMEKQSLDKSQHIEIVDNEKSVVYSKRRTRALTTTKSKIEPEPIHMTRRTTRKQKQTNEGDTTTNRQTRKRKQSKSDDDDGNNNTVALRKKKAAPPPAKPKTRKTRVKKIKEVPIREPSPLPIIDRTTHYSTRFSTRILK